MPFRFRGAFSLTGLPAWVTASPAYQQGAAMITDWTQPNDDGTYGQAYLRATNSVVKAEGNVWTSPASTVVRTAIAADGTVVVFPVGSKLRATSAGLTTEEARTNSIRNNTMQGAVAGSPGTLPTFWTLADSTGALTRQIVGVGTINGMSYIDIRLSGTPSTTAAQTMTADAATPATTGDTWANSFYLALIAGSFTNVSGSLFTLRAGGEPGTSFTPTSTLQRYTDVRTLTGTNSVLTLRWAYANTTTPVDFTLRIAMPQSEKGAFATTPIPTSGAAVTRAQDFVSASNVSWLSQGAGSVSAQYSLENVPASGARVAELAQAASPTGNRFGIDNNSTYRGIHTGNGATVTAVGTSSVAAGTSVRQAAAYPSASTVALSVNGAAPSAGGAITAMSANLDAAWLGHENGGFAMSGTLTQVAFFPTALTNAQLQAVTA